MSKGIALLKCCKLESHSRKNLSIEKPKEKLIYDDLNGSIEDLYGDISATLVI
jgi:hypothetical protein